MRATLRHLLSTGFSEGGLQPVGTNDVDPPTIGLKPAAPRGDASDSRHAVHLMDGVLPNCLTHRRLLLVGHSILYPRALA